MDAPLESRPVEAETTGPVFVRALISALGRVPQWLLLWGLTFTLALVAALPWFAWLEGVVEHRYEAGSVSGYMDEVFRQDHREALAALQRATGESGAVLAFLALLLGVFSAGGWLQVVLERTRGHSMRRFLFGGARYFWRFFRVMLLTLLVLLFWGWLFYGTPFKELVLGDWFEVPRKDWGRLESLDSEQTVFLLRGAQDLAFGLFVALTLCWADYTRTRLALQGTYSAVWAGLQSFFNLLRHPLRMLRPLLMLLLCELAVVLLVGLLLDQVEAGFVGPDAEGTPSSGRIWMIGVLSQLVLAWRVIIRGARYHATALVSQQVVRPISRPDPWRESIGGPGGPRYPLEEGDEYGVAL